MSRKCVVVAITVFFACLHTLLPAQGPVLLPRALEQLTSGRVPLLVVDKEVEPEAPATMVINSLRWRLGWLQGHRGKGETFEFKAKNSGPAGLHDFTHRQGVSGLWVKREWESVISDRCVLTISGSYVRPVYGESQQSYNGSTLQRTWNAKTQWCNLNSSVAYCPYDSAFVSGGLRYDNIATNFSDPGDVFGIASTPLDEADTTISIVQPYVGASVRRVSPWSGLTVGVQGFPCLTGSLDYKETIGAGNQRLHGYGRFRNGYFMEAYTEWITRFMGFQVGLFGKFLTMHGKGDATLELKQAGGSVPLRNDFEITYQRSVWIFGAGFQVSFATIF